MTDILRNTIKTNRAGQAAALPSVCSAHPDVLLASLLLAQEQNQPIIIEATSNQVNQYGGYTGMQPTDFISFVQGIAKKVGFDPSQIIFGGDHLGPQVWRAEPAVFAMAKAEVLVADYVRAGFTKIHLDCSEGCAGEPAQVDDITSAARAAQLAAICESTATNPAKLSYMVGTEVPPPGGAREVEKVVPTNPAAARKTLQAHFDAFDAAGIPAAKSRIAALVVQPGVEFAAAHIDHLPRSGTPDFRAAISDFDGVCFEAHSTDYQHPHAYRQLAEMGFAIQKVGPALTFAYRKALYALDMMAHSLGLSVSLAAEMEQLMLKNPSYWQNHYHGDDATKRLMRHYSYADRIRYYWATKPAQAAVTALLDAIKLVDIPEPVWDQFFCAKNRMRAESLMAQGYDPVIARVLAEIQLALAVYFFESKGHSDDG